MPVYRIIDQAGNPQGPLDGNADAVKRSCASLNNTHRINDEKGQFTGKQSRYFYVEAVTVVFGPNSSIAAPAPTPPIAPPPAPVAATVDGNDPLNLAQ